MNPCTCTKLLYASGTGSVRRILHAGHYGFPDWLAADCKLRHHLDTYFFGNIILLHLVCGMLFAVLMLYRIYWAFVGNKYSRMIFILPFWDMEWIKGISALPLLPFLNKHPKEYVGHNPLAQTAMCLMYVLGSVLIILTGLGSTPNSGDGIQAGCPGSAGLQHGSAVLSRCVPSIIF